MPFVDLANLPRDSFVWMGPDYDPATGIHIVLHYTHSNDTQTCVELYADGGPAPTFAALFEDDIGQRPVVRTGVIEREGIAREEERRLK